MPFKFHSKGRRHIPRQRHRVTNWRDYDTALRNRGSLTIWLCVQSRLAAIAKNATWAASTRPSVSGSRARVGESAIALFGDRSVCDALIDMRVMNFCGAVVRVDGYRSAQR